MFTNTIEYDDCYAKRKLHRCQSRSEINVNDLISNSRVFSVIDSYDSAPFNINEAGFIRNDISQLERASTESERNALLHRLQDFEDVKDPNEKLKIEDRIFLIRPRSCQSMAELEGYASVVASFDSGKIDEAYEKALKDVKVDEQDPAPSSAPAPAPVES